MVEEACVVASCEIGPLVGAAGLLTLHRGMQDGLGNVEHVRQFQSRDQLGVERRGLVVELDSVESLLQLSQLVDALGQGVAGAEDPCAVLHS